MAFAVVYYFSQDLPDIEVLETYAPATVSRVYSGEGQVLDEFAAEKRLYTPADEIPEPVKHAFISAEDKNFYSHAGYDVRGMGAALYESVVEGKGDRGASTIPQQVAKNMFLTGDQSIERKVREIIIANRVVRTIDRDDVLGLYLNEIYLGQNSYGVTAAARTYFAKPLEELNLQEVAYLAALPKKPAELHPVRNYDDAVNRRNFVLREMFENGYITEEEKENAQAAPLLTVQSGDIEPYDRDLPPRDYFTDEIRRQLSDDLGEDVLFSEGLSVRATIDRNLQNEARRALRRALENYDRGKGFYNGAVSHIDAQELSPSWENALKDATVPRDIEGWFPAVVLEAGESAVIGVEGHGEGELPLQSLTWMSYRNADGNTAKVRAASDIFERGDVIFVRDLDGRWSYRQIPTVSGAFAAIDPRNGRVLAVVGGFSYEYSNFNRATQAMRQPGSSFKPFVYAAALDSGILPNATIVDAPIVINTPQGVWRPQNASDRYYGPTPMMTGLEQSRNLMTIRLAQEVGMDTVARYGQRYGAYDNLSPVLANSLGSQETTLYRMISAYSTFANGGKAIEPTVVDRVQDRYGKNIYSHDARECVNCNAPAADPSQPPEILSRQEQVMDPITAYQIMTMLKSVVKNGTAKNSVGKLGLPIAGKTGTTNEAKDVWFIGFTPNIVAGCFIGYDDPRPLGRSASGGSMCGPVFSQFIVQALKSYGGFEYEVPEGGYFVKLDRFSGQRLSDNATGPNVIQMLFRKTTTPAVGSGGQEIDGGFAMGSDVPLFNKDGSTPDGGVKVKVGGKVTAVPKAPSAAAISQGGVY